MNFNTDIIDKTSEICFLLFKSASEEVKETKIADKFKKCFKHLEMLINLQKEYCIISNKFEINRKNKLSELLLKLNVNHNIDVSKSKSGNGYGLVAHHNLDKYDEVIRISENDMITEESMHNSVLGSFFISDSMIKTMPNIALTLFVMNESCNPSSKYRDYIESLPKDVDTYLYLTPKDIDILQHSQYLNEIVRQFCTICCHYCYFFRVLSSRQEIDNSFLKNRFCFEDFRWAVSIIMSRNNYIPGNNETKSRILALIPIWDMMNHEYGEVTTDFDTDKRCLIFYSMKSYNSGDEICMDYGKRSTLHYFMYSGFVPTNNLHDTYTLKIGFNKQDILYEKKKQLLSMIGIDCNNAIFNIEYMSSNVLNKSIILYLTVMLLKTDEDLTLLLKSTSVEEDIMKYNIKIKAEVGNYLSSRIKMNFACVDRMVKKMEDSDRESVRLDCLQLLKHEKRVLEEILKKL